MSENAAFAELISDVKERLLYLQELGVDSLNVALSETKQIEKTASGQPEKYVPSGIEESTRPQNTAETRQKTGSRIAALPSLSNRKPIASDVSRRFSDAENMLQNVVSSETTEALFDVKPTLPESEDTIESIRAEIGNCSRCPLNAGRTQIVHSTGNLNADLMFVGEAPGADEDAQGFPFVGRAGQLLTKMIEGIGYKREDVFIGNISRCRPPGNRQPTLVEAHTCRPFLLREIAVVRPKVVVVLGNTAMHNLLDTKVGITRLRGKFQDYFGVKVMPTFHPAYLLRDPHKKREVWEDLKMVRDYLNSAT